MRRYPPPKTGTHTGWSPGRDRAAQARFRQALIQRSGGRCEHMDATLRCQETQNLQAHHDRLGYDAEAGRLLCRVHHKLEDPHAR